MPPVQDVVFLIVADWKSMSGDLPSRQVWRTEPHDTEEELVTAWFDHCETMLDADQQPENVEILVIKTRTSGHIETELYSIDQIPVHGAGPPRAGA